MERKHATEYEAEALRIQEQMASKQKSNNYISDNKLTTTINVKFTKM